MSYLRSADTGCIFAYSLAASISSCCKWSRTSHISEPGFIELFQPAGGVQPIYCFVYFCRRAVFPFATTAAYLYSLIRPARRLCCEAFNTAVGDQRFVPNDRIDFASIEGAQASSIVEYLEIATPSAVFWLRMKTSPGRPSTTPTFSVKDWQDRLYRTCFGDGR